MGVYHKDGEMQKICNMFVKDMSNGGFGLLTSAAKTFTMYALKQIFPGLRRRRAEESREKTQKERVAPQGKPKRGGDSESPL